MKVPALSFERFLLHEEIENYLQKLAAAAPELVEYSKSETGVYSTFGSIYSIFKRFHVPGISTPHPKDPLFTYTVQLVWSNENSEVGAFP